VKRQRHSHELAKKLFAKANGLQVLLNRIEYIRPCGDGKWRGKCPVHDGENRGTLSIRECSDGRILLHCHAHQCPPAEILQVCGLEFQDIMPKWIDHLSAPQRSRKWHQDATHRDWQEAALADH